MLVQKETIQYHYNDIVLRYYLLIVYDKDFDLTAIVFKNNVE